MYKSERKTSSEGLTQSEQNLQNDAWLYRFCQFNFEVILDWKENWRKRQQMSTKKMNNFIFLLWRSEEKYEVNLNANCVWQHVSWHYGLGTTNQN